MNKEFLERLKNGSKTNCECCGRYAQAYNRRLHTSVCLQLIMLYKLGGAGAYVHASKLIPVGVTGAGDFTKAKYWGLIQEIPNNREVKSSGHWMLTERGVEFVNNKLTIPEVAVVYDDTVLEYKGRQVNIIDGLKRKFDYNELMRGL